MKNFKRISVVLYLYVALVTLAMGTKFLAVTEYFVYHAEASGIVWSNVHPGLQLVFMAVFKVCGAGFLSVSLSMLVVIIFPFAKYGHRWSVYAIPFIGIVFWSIIMAATLYVSWETKADTPWKGSLSCIITMIMAFLLSLIDRSKLPASSDEPAIQVEGL